MKKVYGLLVLMVALLSSQAAYAINITAYRVTPANQPLIDAWITSQGKGGIITLEDFENSATGWYQSLNTNIGTFSITNNTLSGIGSTAYKDSTAPHFQIRDYNADGRKNVVPDTGKMYLDSGDITEIKLDVFPTLNTLFFYMTDPSDVKAITKTTAFNLSSDVFTSISGQPDATTWFVGISSKDPIMSVLWTTTNRNDGYGLDGFSTVAPVPEPGTLLLLGAGLAGLAAAKRRKKS